MTLNVRRLERRARAIGHNFNVLAEAPAMKKTSYLYGYGTGSLASFFGGQHEVI